MLEIINHYLQKRQKLLIGQMMDVNITNRKC